MILNKRSKNNAARAMEITVKEPYDMPIKNVITTTKAPVKIWASDIEESALGQATTIADSMPIYPHLALMPDVHMGKGMPLGGALPIVNAISPYCVGVDTCVQSMRDFGLKCDTSRFSLDEAAEAYKDIRQVVDDQTDLVEVLITELRPYRYPAFKGER